MEIGLLELTEIKQYFQLDKRIRKKRRDIRQLRDMFYSQTLASYTTDNGMQIISQGFRIESKVVDLVDTERRMESCLERLLKKQRYFNQYLQELGHSERSFLQLKYRDDRPLCNEVTAADEQVHAFICEIEEAISHMFGLPIERHGVDGMEVMDSLLAITELLEV